MTALFGRHPSLRNALRLLACAFGLALAALPRPASSRQAERVPPIPPPGVAVSDADRVELQAGIDALGKEIDGLRQQLKDKPALLELLPDVQIYHNAARYALTYNEFFSPNEIAAAKKLLQEGSDRAAALRKGEAPWTKATGLVALGYVSRIDGSVQPYGLVVPGAYSPGAKTPNRLDFWYHGRGETLSELNFIRDRERNPGEFTPADAFVLHPYGRYCCANKFAGEIDTLEALENVKKRYPIDDNRLAVRGFSMGGASCWQFATHYTGLWAAAAPGAGFAETADFLKIYQNEKVAPTWYEKKLWHLYDSTDYAANLYNLPTLAYSGEKDGQRQAARVMEGAMLKEGILLKQVIGANAGHFYTKEAKEEINAWIDPIMAQGRNPVPKSLRFTTWTLRYNKLRWLTVDGMERHWERARADAEIADGHTLRLQTQNVSALTLELPSGAAPFAQKDRPTVEINGEKITPTVLRLTASNAVHLRKTAGHWTSVARADDGKLRKRHGLQGPIDDAFMDRFVMVTPTGTPLNGTVGTWVAAEQAHAITEWRRQFRGEARVKRDTEITAADIADSNLVLWGDPASNRILARIAKRLPIRWDAAGVHVGGKTYAADRYVPVLIFPNPLNPRRYIVLNSGFTYREYDYLNNARQVPKLPDFTVIDTSVPVSSRAPGGVADAGFFDENWQLTDKRE